jgi:hypothetical protein
MIVNAPNPFAASSRCFIFAGLSTYGVLAAVRAFSWLGDDGIVARNLQTFAAKSHGKEHLTAQLVGLCSIFNGDVGTPAIDDDAFEIV